MVVGVKHGGFNADGSVITYTLLCGYSPFRAEDRDELIEETVRARVVCPSSRSCLH
jgi:hypothetical protein